MPKTGNNPSLKPVHHIFGVAKKLSSEAFQKLNDHTMKTDPMKMQTNNTTKLNNQTLDKSQLVMRQYVPDMSQKIFGRHYGSVSKIASFLSPIGGDQIADYLYSKINQTAEKMSATDLILSQAGVKSLQDLEHDILRAGRLSQALIEQNKWLVSIQAGICAPLGIVGLAIDVPLSLIFVLKTVYQTGRAYGFELTDKDQDVIQFIFQNIPIEKIVEKQSLLLLIRSISGALETHDIQKLQSFMGSQSDFEWFSNLLKDQSIQPEWLEKIPKISLANKLTPVILSGLGAVYSWKLIDEAGQQSQHIFSIARDYLLNHPNEPLSILDAYQASVKSIGNRN